MSHNPFIDNRQEDEGSQAERFHLRHALSSRHTRVPDVDSEWEKLKARLSSPQAGGDEAEVARDDEYREPAGEPHRPGRRRQVLYFAPIAALVAIIVTVAAVLLPGGGAAEGGSQLYIAKPSAVSHVTLSSPKGSKRVIAAAKSGAAPLKIIEEVSEPDEFVILETPAVEEISIVLPDSTRVWLWPNSRLEFVAGLTGPERVVTLEGEAYFDVATDSVRPFIVHTSYFNTRVYGTEFLVRASGRDESGVLLVEGSVGVSTDRGDEKARLRPGQEAALSYNEDDGVEELVVSDFDPYPIQQWRDGMFFFDDNELIDILMAIGRWYGISIVAYNEDVLHRRLHFVVDRLQDPAVVVAALNQLLPSNAVEYSSGQISVR